jgi:hypothetical protein
MTNIRCEILSFPAVGAIPFKAQTKKPPLRNLRAAVILRFKPF